MRVSVCYMAQLRTTVGVASETVQLAEGSTTADLVGSVAERHGEALRRVLFADSGRLHPAILVFVGDSQVDAETPVPLRDGDSVTLLAPVAGGAR
jgi:molybdopterin converting factor small subunit